MKVFSLITERDGETKKEPGRATTEIKRIERLYAANTIQNVWDYVTKIEIFQKEGEVIQSLSEVAPAIHVLPYFIEAKPDLECFRDDDPAL